MRTPDERGWLTYCLNIHPAETWEAARAALLGPTCAIKGRVCPDAPFAVGLQFSAETVRGLADPAVRADLARILAEEDYRAVTVNGFPYGPFHGTRVKEDVYQPDWRSAERLAYTTALADLMAEIAPEGEPRNQTVSLSTVPGALKPLGLGAEAGMAANYLRAAAHCARLRDRTCVEVAIAIEPEPYCFLETVAESVAFFEQHLFSDGAVATMADLAGLTRGAAAAALPRYLGLCNDICHAAKQAAYDRIGAAWPLAVMTVPAAIGAAMLGGAVATVLLAAYVAWSGWALSLLFRRRPGDVSRAVVSLIAAVSLYDSVMIAAAGSAWLALLAVAAFAATLALQRLVSGT